MAWTKTKTNRCQRRFVAFSKLRNSSMYQRPDMTGPSTLIRMAAYTQLAGPILLQGNQLQLHHLLSRQSHHGEIEEAEKRLVEQ